MFVKPAPGLTIRDPDLNDHLPEEGRDVPETGYWQRRLADKDVMLVTSEAKGTSSTKGSAT